MALNKNIGILVALFASNMAMAMKPDPVIQTPQLVHRYERIYEILRANPLGNPSINGIDNVFVVQRPDKYVLFRCQNSYDSAFDTHDRIWRMESKNGIDNWTNDCMVIQGAVNAQDDLSCSPGVVVGPDGTWHMYYMTGSREDVGPTIGCRNGEMWHATAPDPGLVWTKFGKVASVGSNGDCATQQPSPVIENGKIAVYFINDTYGTPRLFRIESEDGFEFTYPSPIGNIFAPQARVTRVGDNLVIIYSLVSDGRNTQTDELFQSINFEPGTLLLTKTPNTFYRTYTNAGNYIPGPPARIYFAGNWLPECIGGEPWGTCSNGNTSIGVIVLPVPSVPPVPPIQTSNTSLEGYLISNSMRNSNNVIGLTVTIVEKETGKTYTTVTDSLGHYKFDMLSAGQVTFTALSNVCFNVTLPVTIHTGMNELNVQVCL